MYSILIQSIIVLMGKLQGKVAVARSCPALSSAVAFNCFDVNCVSSILVVSEREARCMFSIDQDVVKCPIDLGDLLVAVMMMMGEERKKIG